MSTSYEIDNFHKYAYIYTIELIGDNRYIIPIFFFPFFFSILVVHLSILLKKGRITCLFKKEKLRELR